MSNQEGPDPSARGQIFSTPRWPRSLLSDLCKECWGGISGGVRGYPGVSGGHFGRCLESFERKQLQKPTSRKTWKSNYFLIKHHLAVSTWRTTERPGHMMSRLISSYFVLLFPLWRPKWGRTCGQDAVNFCSLPTIKVSAGVLLAIPRHHLGAALARFCCVSYVFLMFSEVCSLVVS